MRADFFHWTIIQTFQEFHGRFNFHRHQCLFPGLVEQLPTVAAQRNVHRVIRANGALLYVVDLEEGVEHDGDVSRHREPFSLLVVHRPPETFLLLSEVVIFTRPHSISGIQDPTLHACAAEN